MIAFLCTLIVFVSSYLLFQVQLILGKSLLPWFGGVPSVWITCMLFFQVLLLIGYGWAHVLVRKTSMKRQIPVHIAFLVASAAFIVFHLVRWTAPILPPDGFFREATEHPTSTILFALFATIGPVFFMLATTTTMLQTWFHQLEKRSPYPLYASSNAGSLIGLLVYPFLIERVVGLRQQAHMWFFMYMFFSLLLIVTALIIHRQLDVRGRLAARNMVETPDVPPPSFRERIRWTILAAIGSTALLAFTNQINQEIAAVPFLWVMPLSLYLLTLILAFSRNYRHPRRILSMMLVLFSFLLGIMLIWNKSFPVFLQIFLFLSTLFVVCMISHGELILRRPDPRYLGSFYFYLALGGALGGIFTGILAPLFFNGYWELHIAVAGCSFLFFHLWRGERSPEKRGDKVTPKGLSYYIPPVFISLVLIIHVFHYHRHAVYSARSFFSVLRVEEKVVKTPPSRVRFLMHGITTHGFQFTAEQFEFVPTCYYGPQSGAGLALRRHPKRVEGRPLTVAAVGLGIGTVSAYGREGDNFDFFEIDPDVADLARGKMGFFSFIENCASDVRIITGDGRISLKRAAEADAKRDGIYDVLILDAFSSDSVPTHLLTREAFDLYFRTLKKDGILAVHTSNRTLAISWIVIRQSMHIDIPSAVIITDGDEFTFSSEWVLVTRNPAFLDLPDVSESLVPYDLFEQRYDLHVWTDQYCTLFEIVKNW